MVFPEYFLHWGATGEETPQNLNLALVLFKVIKVVCFLKKSTIRVFLVFLCLSLEKGN